MTHPTTEPTWQQPTFDSGPAMPPNQFSAPMQPLVAATRPASTPLIDQLRMAKRLLWPIALVLGVTSGHLPIFLVIAFVVNHALKRRLDRELWQQRTHQPIVATQPVDPYFHDLR